MQTRTPPQKTDSKTRNALWWGGFLFPSVILQRLAPGVDFLLIGLLISLQERRYADLAWAAPLVIILQEGMGTQEFGAVLLWYASVAVLFSLGRWLFDVESFLYTVLFSACLGTCHFAVVFLTGPLYDASIDPQKLLDESVYLALLVPPAWKAARMTRSWVYADEANSER